MTTLFVKEQRLRCIEQQQSVTDGNDWENAIAESFPDYPDVLETVEIIVNDANLHNQIAETANRNRLIFINGEDCTNEFS